jgi:probable phosphoglycerate mutase
MPDVVLIRPGCTDFDEQNRIQGVLDLPLNHRGHAQVLGLVAQLQEVAFDVVFTAPGEPARSTALAICEQCGTALKEVDDFRNLDHGLWQGLQIDDVRRKYPKVFKQWQESPETVCLPEGETVAEAVERIRRGLRKCLKRKRTIGIVASEPLATIIACVLRGNRPVLPETCGRPSSASRFRQPNCPKSLAHPITEPRRARMGRRAMQSPDRTMTRLPPTARLCPRPALARSRRKSRTKTPERPGDHFPNGGLTNEHRRQSERRRVGNDAAASQAGSARRPLDALRRL